MNGRSIRLTSAFFLLWWSWQPIKLSQWHIRRAVSRRGRLILLYYEKAFEVSHATWDLKANGILVYKCMDYCLVCFEEVWVLHVHHMSHTTYEEKEPPGVSMSSEASCRHVVRLLYWSLWIKKEQNKITFALESAERRQHKGSQPDTNHVACVLISVDTAPKRKWVRIFIVSLWCNDLLCPCCFCVQSIFLSLSISGWMICVHSVTVSVWCNCDCINMMSVST